MLNQSHQSNLDGQGECPRVQLCETYLFSTDRIEIKKRDTYIRDQVGERRVQMDHSNSCSDVKVVLIDHPDQAGGWLDGVF
jgi:hypothetical protein